jgi:protein-arginine kinase activator protein McsA
MKCSSCNLNQPIEQFNWKNKNKGIRTTKCKACTKEYAAQHYAANKDRYIQSAKASKPVAYQKSKQYILNYLVTHPCVDCGISDIRVLQFDHRESVGSNGLRVGYYKGSINKLKAEIEKCDVRCANCHMIRTFEQFNWTRDLPT